MILASDVFTDVRKFLDDDNSGRYTEANDLVPAINKAVLYFVAVLNSAFDAKKITPESLRELVTTKVLDTTGTNTKRVDISSITDLWTILGVDPSPVVDGDNLDETVNRWATRMTMEQWNDALADPFSAGTGVSIISSLVRSGYIGPGNFYGDGKPYLMVRPGSIFTSEKAAIWYLKNPSVIYTGADSIEFPRSLYGMLVDKTLHYLSIQQGAASKYTPVSDKEVTQLITLLMS